MNNKDNIDIDDEVDIEEVYEEKKEENDNI